MPPRRTNGKRKRTSSAPPKPRVSAVLPPELIGLVLAYLNPLETPDAPEAPQLFRPSVTAASWLASRAVTAQSGFGRMTRVEGELHSIGDQPAVVGFVGTQEWWTRNKRHRDGDRPAFVGADGTQSWWNDGQRHRDGGQPAIIWTDGSKSWWIRGICQDNAYRVTCEAPLAPSRSIP